ncbi:MAG TPA: hypothetical protein VL172_01765, partial [Kofleriaceae bacterium]|nr:hypothetical protein [Kofleriaceae bacterium]
YADLFTSPEEGQRMVDCQPKDEDGKKRLADAMAEQKKSYPKALAKLKRAVSKSKGKKIEFLTIEPEDKPDEVPVGKDLGAECKVKVAHATQRFEVAYKLDGDKKEDKVTLLRIGGTWYLGEAFLLDGDVMDAASREIDEEWEKKEGSGGDSHPAEDPVIAAFRGYVDGVCACKDMQCAMDLGKTFSEKYKDQKPPNPIPKEIEELSKKMQDCMAKLMSAEMPPPPEPTPPTPPSGGTLGGIDPNSLGLGGDPCDRYAAHILELIEKESGSPMAPDDRTQFTAMFKGQCETKSESVRECVINAQTQQAAIACTR